MFAETAIAPIVYDAAIPEPSSSVASKVERLTVLSPYDNERFSLTANDAPH
jgi:hypothetical protein